jgi:peptidoglycan hydrolase CwlO-like protein
MKNMREKKMKIRIKISNLICAVVMFSFFCSYAFCEELVVDEETVKKPAGITVTAVNMQTQQNDAKIKSIQNSIQEINNKTKELGETIDSIKAEIKTLQEKMSETDDSILKEINKYNEQMQMMDENYSQQLKKVATLEKDFNETQDTVKSRVDKMQSWDDILDVLRKEISNNEIEIARLKKEINELKKQYGYSDNIFNSIAMWPYTGITALVVSVIAFMVAIIKQ